MESCKANIICLSVSCCCINQLIQFFPLASKLSRSCWSNGQFSPREALKKRCLISPTHLRGNFLHTLIPWTGHRGQLSRSPPPNLVFKALHPGKVSREFKAWPCRASERSRTPAEGQRKARSERPLWLQIGPSPLTGHPLHRVSDPEHPKP